MSTGLAATKEDTVKSQMQLNLFNNYFVFDSKGFYQQDQDEFRPGFEEHPAVPTTRSASAQPSKFSCIDFLGEVKASGVAKIFASPTFSNN